MDYIFNSLVKFLNKYCFLTILIFATWPNMTCEMCGITCGYCKVPVSIFLSATITGKALIKAPIQLYMFINYLGYYIPDNKNIYMKVIQSLLYFFTIYIFKIFIETLAEKELNKKKIKIN